MQPPRTVNWVDGDKSKKILRRSDAANDAVNEILERSA